MKDPWFVAFLQATCHFVLRKRDTGAARNVECCAGQKTSE